MGLRVLHCIRHGHYHTDLHHPENGHLTETGRRQADAIAAVYRDFPAAIMYVSTMARAQQTAEALDLAMPAIKRHNSSLLRELIPAATREHIKTLPSMRGMRSHEVTAALAIEPDLRTAVDLNFADLSGVPVERERGYRIAQRHFRPWGHKGERHELLICHGNLIRFLVCLVLGAPPENWLAMHTHHASITRFTVHPDGDVMLDSYNETMHLPKDLVTSM